MKICIYGLGAVGGLIAAKLSAGGHEITGIARGETLKALRKKGVGVQEEGATRYYPITVTENPEDLGPQDLVIIAVKEPALGAIARNIAPLVGSHTRIMTAMNGVPWWFLEGVDSGLSDTTLRTLDPHGDLPKLLPTEQLIGCVVHLSCSTPEPGVTALAGGNRLIIGQPDCQQSEPLQAVATALNSAGFDVQVTKQIHQEIWFKLWGNMTMNPVSALTRATTDRILDDELVNEFCCKVMEEAARIGNHLGCVVDQTPQQRNKGTRALGAFKTSMLQDVEKGNALEYEALVGAVYEIARKVQVQTPNLAALYGLIRLLGGHDRL